MGNKELLRRQILEIRKKLTLEELIRNSNQVFHRLIETNFFQEASSVFTYLSFAKEIETRNMIQYSLKKGKRVGLPKINHNEIVPIVFNDWNSLRKGYSGILEPIGDQYFEFDSLTLILVPGVVFDRNGNRIGFGKGFYDRFLAGRKNLKIGLAHSFQVVQRLEPQKTDIPVDLIVTEKEIIDFRNKF